MDNKAALPWNVTLGLIVVAVLIILAFLAIGPQIADFMSITQ